MKVADFKKRVRRTTEKSFEDLCAEVWLEREVHSRHMSDRFSGVPDRYITGGKWVELKSLDYARGIVPHFAGLSPEQERFLDWAVSAGDECWYLALITSGTDQFVIFCPYMCLVKDEKFDVRKSDWCHPYDGKATIRKIMPKDWYV